MQELCLCLYFSLNVDLSVRDQGCHKGIETGLSLFFLSPISAWVTTLSCMYHTHNMLNPQESWRRLDAGCDTDTSSLPSGNCAATITTAAFISLSSQLAPTPSADINYLELRSISLQICLLLNACPITFLTPHYNGQGDCAHHGD